MLHPTLMKYIDVRAPYTHRVQITLNTVSGTGQGTDKFIVQNTPFIVTRIRASAWYTEGGVAKRIVPTATDVDQLRLSFKRTGNQSDYFQNPIDIQAFNEAYGDYFPGFLLPERAETTVTVTNDIMTASNFAGVPTVDVAFIGYFALPTAPRA